jgi:hypothetical protein
MQPSENTWQFASNFDTRRRVALESVANFGEVIERVLANAIVVNFNVCRGKVGLLRQCCRPEFELTASPETVDLFFNSPAGYRAQYLTDPDEGQKQNARLISALASRLIAYTEAHPANLHMATHSVRLALSACSAKVWLPESSVVFNHELIEEITVPRWRLNALAALDALRNHTRPDPEQQEKAIWGLRASRACSIEVKGTFLSSENEEVVSSDKINRRLDIHQFGYA